ncbi:hypothetical protein ACODM8_16785 [Vibrio ostreicida]|uniref:LysB family phage lysis regulatory protein n=1 Tax=Vibrio ostreicida TaxID=526588 RepID=A0ABT8BWH7_9VIBR|nr:hypothetical protein [Vibrio ostreicida]MDN3611343.1 hypothetical protein [Vibrio ostreicida]NPD09280.1 hypothetical protein [Vibrio ostreicida]
MNRILMSIVAAALTAGVIGYQRLTIASLDAEIALHKHRAENAIQRRNALATELQASEASKQTLLAGLQHSQTVLADRDAALQQAQQKLAELSNTLRGLRKNDNEYKYWSQARVPDGVIRLLRHSRTGESDRQNGG